MAPFLLFFLVAITLSQPGAAEWINFANHEYKVDFRTVSNFSAALGLCEEMLATLVVVESENVLDFLLGEIGNLTDAPHTFYVARTNLTDNDSNEGSNTTCLGVIKMNGTEEMIYQISNISCFTPAGLICERNTSLQTTQFTETTTTFATSVKTTTFIDSDTTTPEKAIGTASASTQTGSSKFSTESSTSDAPTTTSNETVSGVPPSGGLTHTQVTIISAVGACVGTLLVTMGCFLLWRITRGRKILKVRKRQMQALSLKYRLQNKPDYNASYQEETDESPPVSKAPKTEDEQACNNHRIPTKVSYKTTQFGSEGQKSPKSANSTDFPTYGQHEDQVFSTSSALRLKRRASFPPDFHGNNDVRVSYKSNGKSKSDRASLSSIFLKRNDTRSESVDLRQSTIKDLFKIQTIVSEFVNGSTNVGSTKIQTATKSNIQKPEETEIATRIPNDGNHTNNEKSCSNQKEEGPSKELQDRTKIDNSQSGEIFISSPQPGHVKMRHGEKDLASKGRAFQDSIAKGVRRLSQPFRKGKMFEVVFAQDADDDIYLTMTGNSKTKTQEQPMSDDIYTAMSGESKNKTPANWKPPKNQIKKPNVVSKKAPTIRPPQAEFRKPSDPYVASRMPWQDQDDSQDYVDMFSKSQVHVGAIGQDSVYTDMHGSQHMPSRPAIHGNSSSLGRSQTQRPRQQRSAMERKLNASVSGQQKFHTMNTRRDDDYEDVSTLPRVTSHHSDYLKPAPERHTDPKRYNRNSSVSPYGSGVAPHVRNW